MLVTIIASNFSEKANLRRRRDAKLGTRGSPGRPATELGGAGYSKVSAVGDAQRPAPFSRHNFYPIPTTTLDECRQPAPAAGWVDSVSCHGVCMASSYRG
jgi:hypothetical protein